MICPLMSKQITEERDSQGYQITTPGLLPAECQKENCAWWNRLVKECSVMVIGCQAAFSLAEKGVDVQIGP